MAAIMVVIAAKKREAIFDRFREHGALSATTATTIEELDLAKTPFFRMQTVKSAVVETSDGRFYLDEEAVGRQQRIRRKVLATLLTLLILIVLTLWLAG